MMEFIRFISESKDHFGGFILTIIVLSGGIAHIIKHARAQHYIDED